MPGGEVVKLRGDIVRDRESYVRARPIGDTSLSVQVCPESSPLAIFWDCSIMAGFGPYEL